MTGIVEKICSDENKHDGDITCIAFHDDHVYTGGADGKIKIWDKDLNLKKTLNIHDCYIYTIAINYNGKLYSAGCDGIIKYTENPLNPDHNVQILMTTERTIQSLFCLNDSLYTGDDVGVVTHWQNDKILFKYNLVEEVKSMAVEKNYLYTVRDLDTIITEIIPGKSGRYTTRGIISGKSPLSLIGPIINERKSYLVFCTRDGKGMILVSNQAEENFIPLWSKEDCHEMIITTICGTDKFVFSGGYDGFVKMWTDIATSPKLVGEINLGNCVNYICNGPDDTVYSASSDGIVRRLKLL